CSDVCFVYIAFFISCVHPPSVVFFFLNDPATTDIYTLSLHDALPIWDHLVLELELQRGDQLDQVQVPATLAVSVDGPLDVDAARSEEHTSELQSPDHLVCRLLLEKKKSAVNAMNKRSTIQSRATIRRP